MTQSIKTLSHVSSICGADIYFKGYIFCQSKDLGTVWTAYIVFW